MAQASRATHPPASRAPERRVKELHCGLPAEVMRLLRNSKKRKAELIGVAQQSGGEEVQGGYFF